MAMLSIRSSKWWFNTAFKKLMSAESWMVPGPNGQRVRTNNYEDVLVFLRKKKEERQKAQELLLTAKTPPPPRFADPARRAPNMRVSMR